MAGLKFGNMTEAINNLDDMGWGRTGAAAGAALGGIYGMFSDVFLTYLQVSKNKNINTR